MYLNLRKNNPSQDMVDILREGKLKMVKSHNFGTL